MSRLAWVDLARQIQVGDGHGSQPLTDPLANTTGVWSMMGARQLAWSWPTFSPDGQWIAAFSVRPGDNAAGPARVVSLALDGVQQVEWAELASEAPIYLQWHPGGEALTVLAQQGSELVLGMLRRDRLGAVRLLEQGVPLFFNWAPGGRRLMIHVGSRGAPDGRLTIRDPLGPDEDVVLDRPPGSFCAPVFAGGRAVYAVRAADGETEVVSGDLAGGATTSLGTWPGLVALLGAPAGLPLVAVSSAPGGEGTPYQGISVIDVVTGERRAVTQASCLAFFWSPNGAWLLLAVVQAADNCLSWRRVGIDGQDPRALGTFWPTRDLLFYLHFFDQYAQSHPIISPDGRTFAYSGYPAGGGVADLSEAPRIWLGDAEGEGTAPEDIAQGSFAVYPPG
jgi:hypothetical protein